MNSSERALKRALVKVGDGRGFVVQGRERMVITAGHCLPVLPPCCAYAAPHERTYGKVVSRLRGPLSMVLWRSAYSWTPSLISPCSALQTTKISMKSTTHTRGS